MYGGNIPADVLKAAMLELDKIQKADALADDDGDGKANENDSTFNFKRNVMPAMAKDVESPQDENPPKRQR
jgi:hypothetical protein